MKKVVHKIKGKNNNGSDFHDNVNYLLHFDGDGGLLWLWWQSPDTAFTRKRDHYPNGMDPFLFSLGSEELKVMFGAALNLNRRVIHAGNDDGNQRGEASVTGSRDQHAGRSRPQKRFTRSALEKFMANLLPCRVGMEACGSAHYWSRLFRAYGHDVRLMSPQFVKSYVKSNKNDCNDAEAICEAVSRPTMRFVAPKTVAQQDLQGLYCIRQWLVQSRTALINQIRGLLAEYGLTVLQQVAQLRRRLSILFEDSTNELTPLGREVFGDLARELAGLNERIHQVEVRIKHLFAEHEACQRLAQVNGVGPLIATTMVASVSGPRAFKNGRQLVAWLGLVLRQRSSGNTNGYWASVSRGTDTSACLT